MSASQNLGVVGQTRVAFRPENRLAGLLGALLGGIVPVLGFAVAHYEWESPWSLQTAFVGGSLLYSAITVWQWADAAFESRFKATGFVLALEGVMLISSITWLSYTALGYLVAINAVATACTLARGSSKTKARKRKVTPKVTEKAPQKSQPQLRRVG